MKGALAVIAAIAAFVSTGKLLAHEGHAHKVMGTVAVIDATHIEVVTKEGKKESFLLTKETKYLKGKAAAAAADVKVGARAVVSAIEKDGKKLVTEVLLGEEKAMEGHDHKH